MYDATGIKLQKKVSKNGTVVKTTNYVGGLVYEGTTDKFLHTEEGRVVLKENGQEKEEYQYHLKDHLGNVRVTFTTANREELTNTYLATMENAYADLEASNFDGLETRQSDTEFNHTPGGSASARLNVYEQRIMGPSMSLEVMAGDKIDIKVYARYDKQATTEPPLSEMAFIVASAITGEPVTSEGTQMIAQSLNTPLQGGGLVVFKNEHTVPKAYLNFLFFDKNMNYEAGGFKQVSENAMYGFEEITLDFTPQEEGYLLVYVANQSEEDLNVYFDDLEITHVSGPIVRVDDYYPFGMAFNTGTLAGALTNKYLYNGKELQQELGLDWYDYGARMYDAQLGRWHAIDPAAELYYEWSTYQYVRNNPIRKIDPNGMWDDDYYNRKGEYLYTDNQKTDNIKIVSENGEALASLVKGNGSDDYENVLQNNSVGINDAKLSDEAASKIFTDILDKMPDVDISNLHNGQVSIYNGKSDKDGNPAGYNNPNRGGSGLANAGINSEGKIELTVNFTYQKNSELGTVSNVQNALGVHEYQGHGIYKFGLGGGPHSEAYNLQEQHPSWEKTTPTFQRDMIIRKNELLKIGD